MKNKITIGLVEDQVLFRQGLKAILENWPEFKVVFESADGYSVIEKLKDCAVIPDIMLTDLSLPANGSIEYGGLQLTLALAKAYPAMKIIALSVHENENFISEMIENGAHGYLVKDCDPQELCQAIKMVISSGSYINERSLKAIQQKMGNHTRPPKTKSQISKREQEVLQLVCEQYTADEIAIKLFISVKTVNGHRTSLLQKTGSRNVTGLVLYAIKNQIITL